MGNEETKASIAKVLHLTPMLLVSGMAVLLMTGCLGPKVLSERTEHLPAADPKVELRLKPGEPADVLVLYDDQNPQSGKVTRRAFYLFANYERVTHGGRPDFVAPRWSKGLLKILVLMKAPGKDEGTPEDLYAIFSSPREFKLLSRDREVVEFRLPEYSEWLTAKKLFLFPAAVTADAVGAGAALGAASAVENPQAVVETVNALAHKH